MNAGLSPEQLGHKVGLSGMTIRRIEDGRGRPTPRTMFLLARELGENVTTVWPLENRR
jgi:DNA-binding XRE family transcriptional regulator